MPQTPEQLERIHALETDVSLLKKDSEIQTKILDKLDITVENIHDLAQSMHRMVSIHEERFRVQDKENSQLEQQILERREETLKDVKALQDKIGELERTSIARMEEIKHDVASSRELIVKLTNEPDPEKSTDKEEVKKIKAIKFVIDYWKYLLFVVTFLAGILTHKWGLMKSILGLGD